MEKITLTSFPLQRSCEISFLSLSLTEFLDLFLLCIIININIADIADNDDTDDNDYDCRRSFPGSGRVRDCVAYTCHQCRDDPMEILL